MPRAAYDEIGVGYARHRQPDPRIQAAIASALGAARTVLNVGAGTGSYEPTERCVVAIEPSSAMIAQRPRGAAPCVQGRAESLPFGDGAFDAGMALLTVHHWATPRDGLRELARVARGVVVFCFDPTLHNDFWLWRDYIPAIAHLRTTAGAPSVEEIASCIDADQVETVVVPHDCVDGFGWAYWRRPEAYLDEGVRRGISGFGLAPPNDVRSGLDRLRADLASGAWHEKYGSLLDLDAIDGGFRLIVRHMR